MSVIAIIEEVTVTATVTVKIAGGSAQATHLAAFPRSPQTTLRSRHRRRIAAFSHLPKRQHHIQHKHESSMTEYSTLTTCSDREQKLAKGGFLF